MHYLPCNRVQIGQDVDRRNAKYRHAPQSEPSIAYLIAFWLVAPPMRLSVHLQT